MNIGFIGAGNMGEAIIAGLYKKNRIYVVEMSLTRRAYLKTKYRCVFGDMETILAKSDYIVLAVKPQDLEPVLNEIAQFDVEDKVFVSIAAGITSAYIEKILDQRARVIRTMPNMPAMVGKGVTGIAKGRFAKRSDLKEAEKIFEPVGEVLVVEEKWIDGITAVSGSGPAYLFYFVECLTKSAMALGFSRKQAQALAESTVLGSAQLLAESDDSAETLRAKVTSKGGTTEAALNVLMKKKFDGILTDALKAARVRAKELSK